MYLNKLFFSACFLFLGFNAMAQQTQPVFPKSKNGFIVISHRGNHVVKPENTIAAIEEAIRVGADYVELDLRTTKDGELVLCHNETVDSKTDGNGQVKDLTWAQVAQLKAKSSDGKIYRIPKFTEVLAACKGKINIYLDFKEADVAQTYQQILAAGMEKNVAVYLNKIEQYFAWRKVAPAIPLISSLPAAVKTEDDLKELLSKLQLDGIDNVTDTTMLKILRNNGINVWLDVQSADEGPEKWAATMKKGVQGVQTDHPEELIKYLNTNKLRNGATVIPIKYPVKAVLNYRKLADVPYSFASPENTMDVYLPKTYDHAKVIVYIHGGSWITGDKAEFPAALIEELVGKRKYILISLNYRLAKDGKNKFPSQMQDISSAMAFLTMAANKYNFNANEFAFMGTSAGAHMALLYAYGYDDKKQVKTIVDYWGPTDLTDTTVRKQNTDGDKIITNLLSDDNPHAKIAFDASPYYKLTKETAVPTALFHGGADPLVDVSQAKKLDAKLQSLNVATQLTIYPNEKHSISPAIKDDLFGKTIAWFEKYFPAK